MWSKRLHHSKLSRYTQLLDTRAIVVGSLWYHIVGVIYPGLPRSTDCHVNVTFQSFCPGLICCSLLSSSAPLLPSQPMSLNCFMCSIAYTRFAVLVRCSDVYIVPDLWCGQRSTSSASSTTSLGLSAWIIRLHFLVRLNST